MPAVPRTHRSFHFRAGRLAALLALLCLGTPLAAHEAPALLPGPSQALRDQLQAKFEELYRAGHFPGGTAGFALPDGTSFALAVGVSDRGTGTPMKTTDRLLTGSAGKTYVAALALQYVKEGRLGLDDPIAKWLGQERWFGRLPNAADITVRHLMTHTSGLVRYELNPKFTTDLSAHPDKVWTPEERLAYLFDSAAPFAPGQGWDYSDTNYIVLGLILERIGGAPYYEQLRKRLLEPLALHDTVPADSRTVPGLVQGYAGAHNPFGGTDEVIWGGKFVVNPQFEWTGGGLACTSQDLARWAQKLYQGKVVDASLMAALLDGVPARLGLGASYGLGVILRPTVLGITYGHSGFMPGYQTEMMYFPLLRTAIAVQVNTSAPRSTGRPLAAFITEFAEILFAASRHSTAAGR
jgi:D-alanyl-D-alanine carboxypeptidase